MQLASLPYIEAMNKAVTVAIQVTQFIRLLDEQLHMKPHRISIAGHSLGAHIAGRVGAMVKRRLNSSIGMIFGKLRTNINSKLCHFIYIT